MRMWDLGMRRSLWTDGNSTYIRFAPRPIRSAFATRGAARPTTSRSRSCRRAIKNHVVRLLGTVWRTERTTVPACCPEHQSWRLVLGSRGGRIHGRDPESGHGPRVSRGSIVEASCDCGEIEFTRAYEGEFRQLLMT